MFYSELRFLFELFLYFSAFFDSFLVFTGEQISRIIIWSSFETPFYFAEQFLCTWIVFAYILFES